MERLTKIAVTLWACAIVAWQASLMRSWPGLLLIAGGCAALSMAITYVDRRGIGIVLALAYVFPALVSIEHGPYYGPFAVLWMAGIMGAILPDALRTPWHIPVPWRAALVFTALAVCVGALIVVWREVDGTLVLFDRPIYWQGGAIGFLVTWVMHVALIAVIGILWFDWLCGGAVNFEQAIVTPLVFSALVMSTVTVYQMFVDINMVNGTAFATLGRATGTMLDANVTGMLAALWTGGTFLWAERLRGWRVYVAPFAIVLNWIAAWGSGSRTAFLAASAISVATALTAVFSGGRLRSRRVALVATVALLVIGGAVAFAASNTQTVSPVGRLLASLPFSTTLSVREFAAEMWNRNGYGPAAVAMIRRFPLSGVGIGCFYGFAYEYSMLARGVAIPPDNAQNWLRHQVAELGLVGALGWTIWFFGFAWFVIVPHRGEPPATWVARAMLIAFGGLSLMAMPGQDPMVSMTFWTIAFWYVNLTGRPGTARSLPAWNWIAVGAALVVFAAGAISAAGSDLRLPERALRAGASFSYGFDVPAREGQNEGYRRTLARAIMIVDATPRWMAVSVRLENRGDATRPVEVRVWKGKQIVLKAQLADAMPVTGFVPVETAGRTLLEVSAHEIGTSRLWQSSERDIGLLVKWDFVDYLPPRFQGYPGQPRTGS